jgi:glycosyltransferase involved in cell wall biosynthesis
MVRSLVVVPAYNEARTLPTILADIRQRLDAPIIVVDDGSTDDTRAVLARETGVVVVQHERNLGYGRTLLDGFERARALGYEAVVTVDGDGQHAPEEIPRFLAALARGDCDVVSGSRFLPQSRAIGEQPVERRKVNRTVLETINRATGWGLTDGFCGFKAYRLDAVARLPLAEAGYGFPVELWGHAWRAGLRIVEIPVDRIYHDAARQFPPEIQDRDARLSFYLSVWERATAGGGA